MNTIDIKTEPLALVVWVLLAVMFTILGRILRLLWELYKAREKGARHE